MDIITEVTKAADSGNSLIFLRPVSYTHLRAHETDSYLVCRLLLEKKKKTKENKKKEEQSKEK